MTETARATLRVAVGDRDELRDLALDYLGGGPLEGDDVGHVRQLVSDLGETGNGPVDLAVKQPEPMRRALKKLRETAAFQGDEDGIKACDRVLSSLDSEISE